jgi:hypothetical protein
MDAQPSPAKHRLSEIDTDSRTAICAACGPVTIRVKGYRKDGQPLWRCNRKDRAERSRHKRIERHGLPRDVAAAMRADQTCAICRSVERLTVDHCHRTGTIRGVICHKCNTGIGLMRDDPAILYQAIQYLLRY